MKHAVMCNEQDLIAAHGIIQPISALRCLRPGDSYKALHLPHAPQRWPLTHTDHILKDRRQIGYSSRTTYSYYFREVLSMGSFYLDASQIVT